MCHGGCTKPEPHFCRMCILLLGTTGVLSRIVRAIMITCAVLPVNLAGTRIEQLAKAAAKGHAHAAYSTFARLTLSNLRKGSSNYW